MLPNSIFKIFMGIFIVIAFYQLFLICFSVPMVYPLMYRIGMVVICLAMAKIIHGVESDYETPEDGFVNRVIFFTKTVYDECNFMFNVVQGNIKVMKKDILKENDRNRLGILERKYRRLEALAKILEKQSEVNREFHDGMVDMDNIEKDLQEFDTRHK